MKSIEELILSDHRNRSYTKIDDILVLSIGLSESFIYEKIISKFAYFLSDNNLTDDGFFYWTISGCEKETGLGETAQRRIFKKLQEFGLIEINNRPDEYKNVKRYIKLILDSEIIIKMFKE